MKRVLPSGGANGGLPRVRFLSVALVLSILQAACEPNLLPEVEQTRLNQEQGLIANVPPLTGCQSHVEIHDTGFWAKELGIPEHEVLAKHSINLSASAPPERGRAASQLLPGARALIVDETADAYRVRNPVDRVLGWVPRREVARTLRLDVASLQPC